MNIKHTLSFFFFCFSVSTICAQPKVAFNQVTQELGTLLWHQPRTATFEITNKGTEEMRLTEVRTDCGCTDVDYTRTPIQPGGKGTIKVTYDAELLGRFSKGILVKTSVQDLPFYLTIVGTVAMKKEEADNENYAYQIGDLYLSTDNVEFDDVNRGDTPVFTIYLLNTGKTSYAPELMHLPKYLVMEADPQVIRPGRSGRILLTLNSHELHNLGLTQTSIYLSRRLGDRVSKENEITVNTTLLPDFLDTPTQLALAPMARIDTTRVVLDLEGGKRKKATTQIELTNDGKTPLVISALQVYNPGLSVSLSKRRLNPGQTEKLKISVHNKSHFFKGRRRVLLITNDPRRPKIVIDVKVKK